MGNLQRRITESNKYNLDIDAKKKKEEKITDVIQIKWYNVKKKEKGDANYAYKGSNKSKKKKKKVKASQRYHYKPFAYQINCKFRLN